MKSDSFDPSETESSTSERTSVEGERRVEEEEEGRREEVEESRRRIQQLYLQVSGLGQDIHSLYFNV